jgi:NAD+ diphosphatase
MRHAETVTFGGSGLDRAAALRGRAAELQGPQARCLALWRGKVLASGPEALCWLPFDSPVFAAASDPVLLTVEPDGRALFARSIADWSAEAAAAAQAGGFFDPGVQTHPLVPPPAGFHELRAIMTGLDPRAAELAATARAVLHWHRSHAFCAACGHPSDSVEGGWQRRCPACGASHFPRTDPVVIMLVTRGNAVLMGRSPGWPEGMFSLLAGFVEPGETVEAAVRREVAEESGVQVGAVRYLASQPWPFPASLMLGCQAEALTEAIRCDPAELEEALWLSREEMVTVMAGLHPRLKPARRGAIAHFLIANWLADRLD